MHVNILCRLSALLLCIFVVQCYDKVNVSVYYESLGSDSRKFFTSQLYPTLENLNVSHWINLTLVPYGKSMKSKVGDDQWQFYCHHGPYECIGNKIHACAIHEIEKSQPTPAGVSFNLKTVAFINCLMAKAEDVTKPGKPLWFEFHIDKCVKINHIPNYNAIENCKDHPSGSIYLADLGYLTEKVQAPLESVPTIVFNGRYKKEDNILAKMDFVKAVCQYITENAPIECKRSPAPLIPFPS